jgi:Tfp pilus assembly protein PilF
MLQDEKHAYFIAEDQFNTLGYRLLGEGRTADAIAVFLMNVEAFPSSANVYDSLAEAYMQDGQNELAVSNYKKSLELNPENTNAVEMLEKLSKTKNGI